MSEDTRGILFQQLYDECNRLIAENNHLRTQFEVSQGIADLAIQQRDQAIAERDEWHRLAVESDRKCCHDNQVSVTDWDGPPLVFCEECGVETNVE
jgi:hypothetical protein